MDEEEWEIRRCGKWGRGGAIEVGGGIGKDSWEYEGKSYDTTVKIKN